MLAFPTYHGELPQCLNPSNPGHYLLLAFWIYFRPTALKSYLFQADPDLYRTGQGKDAFHTWNIPAYRNLYLMIPGTVLLITTFVILLGLPVWPAASWTYSVSIDWSSWMLDMVVRTLTGALIGPIAARVALGMTWVFPGGLTKKNLASTVVSGVIRGIAGGVALGIAASVVSGLVVEMSISSSGGLSSISFFMGVVACGVLIGLQVTAVNSALNRLSDGVATSIPFLVACACFVLFLGLLSGMQGIVRVGGLFALIFGVSMEVGALRIPFYPFQFALALISLFTGREHPLEWDECLILPLPGTLPALTRQLRRSELDGLRLSVRVICNPCQNWIAQRCLRSYARNQATPLHFLYALLANPNLDEYALAPVNTKEWEELSDAKLVLLDTLGKQESVYSGRWISQMNEAVIRDWTRLLRDHRKTPLTRFAALLYRLIDGKIITAEKFDLSSYADIYASLREYPGGEEIATSFEAMATFLSYDDLSAFSTVEGLIRAPFHDQHSVCPTLLDALSRLDRISTEIAACKDKDQDRRSAALTDAADVLNVLDEDLTQIQIPERFVLQRIVNQWRMLTSEASGTIGSVEETTSRGFASATLKKLFQFIGAASHALRGKVHITLDERPGVYWKAISWVTVGIALVGLWSFVISFVPTFVQNWIVAFESVEDPTSTAFPSLAPGALTRFALPVALVATMLHRLTVQTSLVGARRVLSIALSVILATAVYLLPAYLPLLPRLLGADIPITVTRLAQVAWPAVTIAGTIALAVSQSSRPTIGTKLVTMGILAGATLAIVLAYPVYTSILNLFAPEAVYRGWYHDLAIGGCSLVALLIILGVGPVTVVWTQPRRQSGQLVIGIVAGMIAGAVLFGLLGAPAAGMAAQGSLYGVAFSRADYANGGWLLKLGPAINAVIPITLVTTWLLVLMGGIIGGISGLLTPSHSRSGRETPSLSFNALLLDLIGGSFRNLLLIAIYALAAIVLLALLAPAIKNILDSFGIVPLWQPWWSIFTIPAQFWLAVILLLALIVVGLRRQEFPLVSRLPPASKAFLILHVCSIGFAGAFVSGALYLVAPSLWIPSLVILVLSLEIISGAGNSWRRAFICNKGEDTQPLAGGSGRTGMDLVASLLTCTLGYQFYISIASLTFVAVRMIPILSETTAPPPGISWLERDILSPFFVSATCSFYLQAIFHMLYGLSLYRLLNPLFQKATSSVTSGNQAHEDASELNSTKGYDVVLGDIRIAQINGGLLLVLSIGTVFLTSTNTLVITVLAALGCLLLTRHYSLDRLPLSMLATAFAIAVVGLIGLILWGEHFSQLAAALPRLLCALVLGPAIAIVYRALQVYSPVRSQPILWLAALFGTALLAGLLDYTNQYDATIKGGVSRFNGREWEVFTSEDSPIGGRLNYQFFFDSNEQLWFGGGTGVIVNRSSDGWHSYLVRSLSETSDRSNEEMIVARLLFLEDEQNRMWVAEGETFGQFDPTMEANNLRVPSRPLTEVGLENQKEILLERERVLSETLAFEASATDMALDIRGDLWLALDGEGVLWLEGGRDLDNARWEFFTAENSPLTSSKVHLVYADQAGGVWFSTERGLCRFDGKVWQTIVLPDSDMDVPLNAFLEDSQGSLWIGAIQGGYLWNDQRWIPFSKMLGWPDKAEVVALFEDSQDGLWAGTEVGAFRYDGHQWTNLVPDVTVITLDEGPPGVIWVGGVQGLIRYELETKDQILFNSNNSGMVTDWVQDLHVSSNGELWVSTFSIDFIERSPWWAIGLSVSFFGYLFVNTYRGYNRTVDARARRLGRRITARPDSLYSTVYALLVEAADAPEVITRLAEHLLHTSDSAGAAAISALAALSTESEMSWALDQSIAALANDSARISAAQLCKLHRLLAAILPAQSVQEIADLDLTVDPSLEPGIISIHSRSRSIEELPQFLSPGTAEAWRKLEQVNHALRKYQQVEAVTDRLSYLAMALGAIERAQATIQSVGPPEGPVMVAIADHWRTVITGEIGAVSGRADLRLELRTRQVRRADRVTLALYAQNIGRAAAENVVVALQSSEGFSLSSKATVIVGQLSSGHSASVEFTIAPSDFEGVRIACRVTWDDRIAVGNKVEFADMVRFYEVTEEFQRISNPYIVGHPVKSSEMFHGRRDIFQFVAENLSGPAQDRTLMLHGQRRTGKTSILYQLLQGRLGGGFIPVLIDMQELAPLVNSMGDLFSELAYQLARVTRKAGILIEEPSLEDFATLPTRVFSRFLDELEDRLGDQRVVVMFDEFELIEDKIAEGVLTTEVLGYFRSLIQHRDRLIFIFTGTHRLEEMTHDYWSVFFNIALYRQVSFLSPPEAAQLIREPVAGDLDIDELAVEKVIHLTSGHPYFIQLICWALVNHCNKQQRNYATINDVNQVVQEILMTGEAHFAYIWQRASAGERLMLAGLAHTLQPGKLWARPDEVLETLSVSGDRQTQRPDLIDTLERLAAQEVLESAGDGVLRYRFQLEVLRLWIKATKSVAALVEHKR